MTAPVPRRTRRTQLAPAVVLGAVLLAACGADADPPASPAPSTSPSADPTAPQAGPSPSPAPDATATGPTTDPSPDPSAEPSPDTTPDADDPAPAAQLPPVNRWQPAPTEISPEIKVAAAAVVEALGTVDEDGPDPAERLREIGADPALADQAGPVVPPGERAVTEIVYPQYGGLEPDDASVMTVLRQTYLEDDEALTRIVTVDVHLVRDGDEWVVSELLPVPVEDPPTIDPASTLADVVDAGRVDLPPIALGDLTDSRSTGVVAALDELGTEWTMRVSVARRGHDPNVFGTDRPSQHGIGRAVDVWEINGVPVVELDPDDAMLEDFLTDAATAGFTSIGSPRDLDGGPGGTYFSDDLHRDHVHLAVRIDR